MRSSLTTQGEPGSQSDGDARHAHRAGVGSPIGLRLTEAGGLGLLGLLVAVIRYRVWDADFSIPFAASDGDLLQMQAVVKAISENGWYLSQPRLGAPFIERFEDFPLGGETLQLALIRLLTLVAHGSGTVMNLYYLIGFFVLGAIAYLVLCHVGLSRTSAGFCSLMLNLLPYHFFHGQAHLLRSTYIPVPLGLLLMVWLSDWRSRFLTGPDNRFTGRDSVRWARVFAAIAVCLVIGAWDTILTAFVLLLVAILAILWAVKRRDFWILGPAVAMLMAIFVSFVVVSLPSLLFWARNGSNKVAARRYVIESEYYGLKLNRVVLPSDGSRIPALRALWAKASLMVTQPSEGGQSIGVVAAVGLIGILVWVLIGSRRANERRHDIDGKRYQLQEIIGFAAVVGILFATIAGFSTVTGLLGLSSIRTWARMAVFLGIFALIQVGLWMDRWKTTGAQRVRKRQVGPLLAVLLIFVTLYTGPPVVHVDYAATKAQVDSDQSFVAQIERTLPAGANVMQLPVMPFPEAFPPGAMGFYEPLRAYLADTGGIRWSYGGIKGRPEADWQNKVPQIKDPRDLLTALLGMGFSGLWVTVPGYSKDQAVLARIRGELRDSPLLSANRRYEFHDLRPYRARLGLSSTQLREKAITLFGIAPPR